MKLSNDISVDSFVFTRTSWETKKKLKKKQKKKQKEKENRGTNRVCFFFVPVCFQPFPAPPPFFFTEWNGSSLIYFI